MPEWGAYSNGGAVDLVVKINKVINVII